MIAPAKTEFEEVSRTFSVDAGVLIDSLRAAGAQRFDAVRLHYLEVLARRASAHQGSIRRMLDARLSQALAAFQERFTQAYSEAVEAIARCVLHHPHSANELQQLLVAGNFKDVRRKIATLKAGEQASLGALVRQLEHHAPDNASTHLAGGAVARPELKTLREFRSTWSKLSIDKQLAQALEQAPTNAGPINSHMLVLRSLALMRDISPDYLNRFMSYADTLLCLDHGEKEPPAIVKKRPAVKRARK
ncbi:MAG TPA: DUF2894 domain-containing protein [Noviherbaspirillum sp.]|nr:DUF2894 domain-containing protein [Noviherbaspirillum sp.]